MLESPGQRYNPPIAKLIQKNLTLAYLLLVAVPVLGLFGILETGRGMTAPPAIGGEWKLDFDNVRGCAAVSRLREPALAISQSGSQASIAMNDGRAGIPASIHSGMLTGPWLSATITGKPGERTLKGWIQFEGCGPVAFRGVHQTPSRNRGK